MPHPRLATETGIASDKEALDSPGKWREQALWKGPPEAPSGSHRVPGILTPAHTAPPWSSVRGGKGLTRPRDVSLPGTLKLH